MTTQNNNQDTVQIELKRTFLLGQIKKLTREIGAKNFRAEDLVSYQQKIKEFHSELNELPAPGKTQEESYEEALAKVQEFLEDPLNEHLYYIAEDTKFARYLPVTKMWKFITKDGIRSSAANVASEFRMKVLLETLEKLGRTFTTKAYEDPSQGSVEGEVLNMMFMDHWLKPNFERSENTKFFDYLLFSIGNYKEENIQHIMQVLGWKYTHPGEWNMPALCLYGRGGSGKNLFGNTIMQSIFGKHQTVVTNFKKLERWDGILAGKMTVMFDEHPGKEDQSTLKAIVGQPDLEVELKGINFFKIANLALYILATNDTSGPIRIENNNSERRWSMIHSTQDLVSVIAKEENCSREDAFSLLKWADANVFRNPDEVSRFLGSCVQEANLLTTVPMALHGEDYNALKETQKDAASEVLEEVFIDYKGFSFITAQTLYELYKVRNKAQNPNAASMSNAKFSGRVADFISSHKETAHIVQSDKRYVVKCKGKPVKATVYYTSKCFEKFDNTQVESTDAFMSMSHLLDNPRHAKLAQLAHVIGEAFKLD